MSDAPHDELDAGSYTAWWREVQAALRGEGATDVPCGTCVACCSSSQFVHIAPDEVDALAHIPAALRFPAPFAPKGHVLLGYDEHGRCPMLVDGGCSIYEHRPRTCRTYDCRVFTATGVGPDPDKPAIVRQAARWRFTHDTAEGHALARAARAAAGFVADDDDARALAVTATQHAVLALELAHHFDASPADVEGARVEIRRRRDARRR